MAKYLGANLVVPAAMAKLIKAKTGGPAMCRYLSPLASACHALQRMAITAIKYGGVVKRSDSILPLPSPLTTDGNRVVTVPADVNP